MDNGLPNDLRFLDGKLDELRLPSHCSGVYFLVCNGKVVYVGRSNNVEARIARHASKRFDQVFVCRSNPEASKTFERSMIQRLSPPLNVLGVRKKKRAKTVTISIRRSELDVDDMDVVRGFIQSQGFRSNDADVVRCAISKAAIMAADSLRDAPKE